MTTNAQSDAITRQLINQLRGIAGTPTADGESRIKAAVMVAYLSGRPAPTETARDDSPLRGFRALQFEFGIQLTGEGMQLTGEGIQLTGEGMQLTGEGMQLTGEGMQLTGEGS